MSNRTTGTVKNWNADRKFGFIRLTGKESDLFFHASAIIGTDRCPAPGDLVEFVASKSADGRPRAERVKIIS
jgi:cold shock CspA family protein